MSRAPLDRCGAAGVRLKWPNDLLAFHDGRWAKLGGILIEIASTGNGAAAAVIGIGLNVASGEGRAHVDQATIDLASLGSAASRNQVLASVLEELAGALDTFEAQGFAPFATHWNARHAFRDQAIVLTAESGGPAHGIARGAQPDGALLVDTPQGPRRVVSGEVSLRLAPGPGTPHE